MFLPIALILPCKCKDTEGCMDVGKLGQPSKKDCRDFPQISIQKDFCPFCKLGTYTNSSLPVTGFSRNSAKTGFRGILLKCSSVGWCLGNKYTL